MHYLHKGFKHVWPGKTLISLDNINVLVDSKSLLTGLSKPSLGVVFLLSLTYYKTERQNISTRTELLNSSQLIDRSLTNGAKLINLPPESPLFGRSDKLVRDLFETKEPVYKYIYESRHEKPGFLHMRKQRRRSAA